MNGVQYDGAMRHRGVFGGVERQVCRKAVTVQEISGAYVSRFSSPLINPESIRAISSSWDLRLVWTWS